jgi:two-component system sensor histidine kinase/response regulator
LVTRHSLREARAGLRILLADDNPVNRLVAAALLERRGHQVTTVEDGRRALEALDASQFDLVLMGVQHSEMDGMTTTTAIRTREAGSRRHTPVLALIPQSGPMELERWLAAGADACLAKPFRPEELLEAIAVLIQGETGRRAAA